jgi:hypothetical protein
MPSMRWMRYLLAVACAGCGDFAVGCGVETPPPPTTVLETAGTEAHGDHSPHHGGVVMMQGDLHYEVVLDAEGRYRLYLTDATRADLPAAAAANASITVMRKGEAPEGIALQIDETGESWVGQGRPVKDPSTTTARVAYTIRGQEPYWIDLPFDSRNSTADPHR